MAGIKTWKAEPTLVRLGTPMVSAQRLDEPAGDVPAQADASRAVGRGLAELREGFEGAREGVARHAHAATRGTSLLQNRT